MSGFTGKTQTFLESTLENDGFFPAIVLGDLQELYRVPAEYSQALVEHHTRMAMIDCNGILEARQAEWQAEGAAVLTDVSANTIGGVNILTVHYKRAVYCRAMGLMVRAFTTLNRRAEAENLAKEGIDVSQDYFAQSNRALRKLLGSAENITAELL